MAVGVGPGLCLCGWFESFCLEKFSQIGGPSIPTNSHFIEIPLSGFNPINVQ